MWNSYNNKHLSWFEACEEMNLATCIDGHQILGSFFQMLNLSLQMQDNVFQIFFSIPFFQNCISLLSYVWDDLILQGTICNSW